MRNLICAKWSLPDDLVLYGETILLIRKRKSVHHLLDMLPITNDERHEIVSHFRRQYGKVLGVGFTEQEYVEIEARLAACHQVDGALVELLTEARARERS